MYRKTPHIVRTIMGTGEVFALADDTKNSTSAVAEGQDRHGNMWSRMPKTNTGTPRAQDQEMNTIT